MTPALLSVLVWIPFLLIAITSGIVFCLLGFKRGAAKAGISLGVTVLSSGLSILLARLLAGVIASRLTPLIQDLLGSSFQDLFEMEHFAALVTGCATAIGALVLFIPVFLLLLLIVKNLTSLVFTAKLPKPKHIGNKLGGLAIGLADAVLMTFLLLLPLYGTLNVGGNLLTAVSAFTQEEATHDGETASHDALSLPMLSLSTNGSIRPINQSSVSPAAKEEPTYEKFVDALCHTPLADVASLPLFSAMYDSMASFTHDGETVSVTKTLTTVSTVATAIGSYQKGEDGADLQMIDALDHLENVMTESNFFAGLACDVVSGSVEEDNILLSGYHGFSDKEILRQDMSALFDLTRSAVKNDLLSVILADEPNLAQVELGTFPYDMAEALNSTESLSQFKANLINTALDAVLTNAVSDEAQREELRNTIGTVSEMPLSGDAVKAEGDSLLLILHSATTMTDDSNAQDTGKLLGNLMEGLARHPSFGVEKVSAVAKVMMAESGLTNSDALVNAMTDALNQAVSRPIGEAGFGDFASTAITATDALQNIANGNTDTASLEALLKTDSATILSVKDTMSADLIASVGLDATTAEKAEALFGTLFETIAAKDYTDAEAKEEAEVLSYALSIMTAASGKTADTLTDVIPEPETLIHSYVKSDILTATVAKLTANQKKDPLALFDTLGKDAKTEMARYIENAGKNLSPNDAAEITKLSALADFLGIDVSLT